MDHQSKKKTKKTKSSSSDKRGRNDLTLQQRIEILDEIHRSKNVSATARMFGIDRRHAHKIKEQEKTIREAFSSGLIPSTRKRLNRSGGGSSVTVIPKKKKNEDGEEEDIQVVKIEVRSPATEEPQIDDLDEVTQDTHADVIDQSAGTSSTAAQSQSESGELRASEILEGNVGVSQPEETIPIARPTSTGTSTGTSTTQHHTETVNTDSEQTETESVQHRTEEDPVSEQSDDRELSHREEQPASIDFFDDQMGPLSNISLRTPGSVDVHEAVEALFSMDTVTSPQTQSITEYAAGCSRDSLPENLAVSQPEETIPIARPTSTGTSTGTSTTQHHTETVNTDSVQTETESVQHRTVEDPVSDQSDDREISYREEEPTSANFCYDQMGPLSNISLRTPGSVEVYEAAESLLSMDTVAFPQTQRITVSVAGCSRDSLPYNPHATTSNSPNQSKGSKGSEGKVVRFVLPTTIKPLNSPPDILNATEDSAAAYSSEQNETTTTSCLRHPDKSTIAGCEHCLQMYCVNCFCSNFSAGQEDCELKYCVEGKQHNTFPLEELTLRLKRKLLSNLELKLRENQQVKLESEAILQDKINKLHQQRDKEIELRAAEIRLKYKSREDMMRSCFSEHTKVKELDNHINILESKKRRIELSTHAHQLGFMLRELQSIPTVRGQMKLCTIGGADNNKVEIIHTRSPPTLGTLQKSIELRQNDYVRRVCHYKGVTYIAYEYSIVDSVDKEGCVTNIITNPPYIWDIAVYSNKIFVLTVGNNISVYTLTGELITTWRPSHNCYSITVSGDLLVLSAPNNNHHLLLIYTEKGEKVRQVTLSTSVLNLYPVDSKSVIVCNMSLGILRVDISTGADMWRRDDIRQYCAVYDGHGNLLVRERETQSIQILDISSGETLRFVSSADIINIIGGRSITNMSSYKLAMTEDDVLTITGRFITNTREARRECLYINMLYDDNNNSLVIPAQ